MRDVLPAIRVPTPVIHRTDDRVIPVESGRCRAEHIPDAKFVEVPGDFADHGRHELKGVPGEWQL